MDQSNNEGFSLFFEPPNITAPSLQQQIGQLLQQRGALRHITKESLQAEVEQPPRVDDSSNDKADAAHDESDTESPQVRQESLWKAREEMLQQLAYAQNEILSALDFVSLLLSANSAGAQSSMSPALKQHVPIGTLERQTVQKQNLPIASRQKLSQVSEGWKSESFKAASNKFAKAAVRLESEGQRQSRYWDQIANLKARGWSISRLPSDSRAIGIHYGFPEAAPQYRQRGFALLQQDESGNLQLDSRSIPDTFTCVKVSIIRNGTETGCSHVRSLNWPQDDILEQVKQARDAIFEEELFHEISREARSIANQGARTQPNAVDADIDTHTRIRIMKIDLADSTESLSGGPDDQLTESIATSLRLLLLLEHSKSRERRARPPAVMALTTPALSEYAILRPVLANLRHQASLSALRSVGRSLNKTFEAASLRFSHQVSQMKGTEDVIGLPQLRLPARSLFTAWMGNSSKIEMEVETYVGAPIYGTIFRSRDLKFDFVDFQAGSFKTMDEAAEYLAHALTLELISQFPEFEVLRPHSGEVTFRGSRKPTAVVSVRPQRISLLVTDSSKVIYSWRPSGFQRIPTEETGESMSFEGVVKKLNRSA